MTALPPRRPSKSDKAEKGRECPAHRQWVRLHACSVCGSFKNIECAHTRLETQGGMGLKPADKWCLSLCHNCHARQHQIGERAFEKETGIDMKALAETFFRKSPHRRKLEEANG
jgi:hypothetical protein